MEISREQYKAFLRMRSNMLKKNIARMAREKIVLRIPWLIFIDEDTTIGEGTIIEPFTVIHQGCHIGARCHIASFSTLADSVVGNESKIGSNSQVFHSQLGKGCEVGDIQIVRSNLGNNCKAKHGRYIGDAHIGDNVNWGAGSVTCNYDGKKKNKTVIGSGAFIGSGCMLVAPVEIGRDAYTAAGSVITKNVPPEALAIGRTRQKNKLNWAQKMKKNRT